MISFATERLMALETEAVCGAAPANERLNALTRVTAIASETGTRRPEPLNSAFRNFATAVTFPVFSNRGGWPKRRRPLSFRRVIPRASRPDPSMIWSRPWAWTASAKARCPGCAEIDERVGTFRTRPIEGDWPYVWLNATYVPGGIIISYRSR
jgi:putative transposase